MYALTYTSFASVNDFSGKTDISRGFRACVGGVLWGRCTAGVLVSVLDTWRAGPSIYILIPGRSGEEFSVAMYLPYGAW